MPQTITKSYEVFTIFELSDSAKEKVCNEYRANYDFYHEEEHLIEMLREDYPHIEDMEIRYSGFWSQGDGASFTGTLDSAWLLKEFASEKEQELIRYVSCSFERFSSHYVHHNTVTTEVTIEEVADHLNENEHINFTLTETVLDGVEGELYEAIECYRRSVCHDIYTKLRERYQECTSDETIIEGLDDPCFLFHEDGTIFQG
jgi:hypothetical protein